jgi:hypothetical protein
VPAPVLPAGNQQRQRDRQIEAAALFGQLGRRQVDRDASGRKRIAGIQQRRAHALAALAHHGSRQTDDGEIRQATADDAAPTWTSGASSPSACG